MTSQIRTNYAEISRLLRDTSDKEIQGLDSEIENNLLEDEVQSDTKDFEMSAQPAENPLDTENVFANDPETLESASSNMSSYIVMPNRWPMAMFYGMMNMAFINAYIIYCDNVLSKKEKPLGRRNFMKKLSNSLMTPWMETRPQMLTLPTNIKEKIGDILPKSQAEPPTQREGIPEPKKRKYCAFCPSKIRRMAKTMCDSCNNPICGDHKSSACPKCL